MSSNQLVTTDAQTYDIDDLCSFLLVGQTGSGKSYLVHSIIEKLHNRYSSEELKYALFDLKIAEFQLKHEDYKPEYLLFDVVKDPQTTLEKLDSLSGIADARASDGVTEPRIVIYVEECDAAMVDQARFDKAVMNIVEKGRKANMTIIYSTSRPATDCISDELIRSFGKAIVGVMASEIDSARFSVPFAGIPRFSFRVVSV